MLYLVRTNMYSWCGFVFLAHSVSASPLSKDLKNMMNKLESHIISTWAKGSLYSNIGEVERK